MDALAGVVELREMYVLAACLETQLAVANHAVGSHGNNIRSVSEASRVSCTSEIKWWRNVPRRRIRIQFDQSSSTLEAVHIRHVDIHTEHRVSFWLITDGDWSVQDQIVTPLLGLLEREDTVFRNVSRVFHAL